MGNFIVSARKYRPTRFDEVVGQGHVSQTLKNALQNDHLAHAFLFCGPRGVGKTTCARILAKVINCENKTAEFEACGTCSSCSSFQENASFNVIELDAASNNSVDAIRSLNEQVRFQPQHGKYKVFIIDEVHMLSSSAFNAFLKTLEEPPPYAIFILATTEKHKIIPTILSRCQIFDFKRIQIQDIISHLKEICTKEGIQAEDDALHVIAQKADGALRDALSIFDRIISFSGDKMVYKDVIDNLNVLDHDYFFQMVDAMLMENLPEVMNIFDRILRNGFDGDIMILGLAEHLRNLLVSKDESTLGLLELSASLKEKYITQSKSSPLSFLLTALNISNECDIHFSKARNKRLHVEMALCKMVYAHRQSQTSFAVSGSQGIEKKTPDLNVSERQEEKKPIESKVIDSEEVKLIQTEATKDKAVFDLDKKSNTAFATPKLSSLDSLKKKILEKNASTKLITQVDGEKALQIWDNYTKKSESPSVRNILNTANVATEKTKIKVEVPNKLHKEIIQQEQDLFENLRSGLSCQNLEFEIKINESLKIPENLEKPKKLYSNKEKYEIMAEANPNVKELTKRLGLKMDHD